MNIYILQGEEQLGPYTLERVNEELTRGHFVQSDFAWHEGLPDWVSLNEIIGLAGTPAPSPDKSESPAPAGSARPAGAHIFVIRNGTALGPFTVEEVKAQMQTGIFSAADIAKHGGSETLWPLLAVPGVAVPPHSRSEDSSPLTGIAPNVAADTPAGFWIRFAAYWVDALVMYVPHLIIALPLRAALSRLQGSDDLSATADVALTGMGTTVLDTCMYWLYFAVCESSSWQGTVGKKLFGLRVTDLAEERLTFGRATGRFFAKLVSFLSLGIGFLMAAFTERKRALHDFMAGTMVSSGDALPVPDRVGAASSPLVRTSPPTVATTTANARTPNLVRPSNGMPVAVATGDERSDNAPPSILPVTLIFVAVVLVLIGIVLLRKPNNDSRAVQMPTPADTNRPSSAKEDAEVAVTGGAQPTVSPQTSPQRWLIYGQNVTLHGVLFRRFHTEWLDMLPDSAEGQKRAKWPAYIVRLSSPIAAKIADAKDGIDDAEQNAREVYLSSLPDGSEQGIAALLGRQVVIVGKLDHAFTVHHLRPVMIDASAITVEQSGEKPAEQETFANQNTGGPNGASAASPAPLESTDSDGGYTLYTNRKHSYSVVVPPVLASTLQENASGDRVTATSDDGRIKLLMRVKEDVGTAETQYKQWAVEHTGKDPGKVVDYKTLHGNWFVVSGHDGPRGYYVKVVVRGSESLFLCLEYDEAQSNDLGKMLTKMSRSFTGDGDSSSGTAVQASPSVAQPRQTSATGSNAQPVPASGSLSRREWRERLRKYCTIPSGHQLISNEKRLFAVMGKPDDVEHEGRNTYWYYKCSDGVVQLAFQLDPEMMGGQIIAEVSDR